MNTKIRPKQKEQERACPRGCQKTVAKHGNRFHGNPFQTFESLFFRLLESLGLKLNVQISPATPFSTRLGFQRGPPPSSSQSAYDQVEPEDAIWQRPTLTLGRTRGPRQLETTWPQHVLPPDSVPNNTWLEKQTIKDALKRRAEMEAGVVKWG